jgi:hypothetical protein
LINFDNNLVKLSLYLHGELKLVQILELFSLLSLEFVLLFETFDSTAGGIATVLQRAAPGTE